MTINLTKRDKVFIIILLFAVIIFLFVNFLILPTLNKKSELEANILTANDEKFNMETVILTLEGMKAAVKNNEEAVATASKDFYPMITPKDIDHLLTGIMKEYNLKPYSLDMGTGPALVGIAPYFASEFSTNGYNEAILSAVYTETVTLTATGSRENFMRLFDRLVSERAIMVQNFSIEERSYWNDHTDFVDETWISLTLSMYLYQNEPFPIN
ncbi:MAG: hypothetical protein RRY79_04255 [Clostridia bacterium]